MQKSPSWVAGEKHSLQSPLIHRAPGTHVWGTESEQCSCVEKECLRKQEGSAVRRDIRSRSIQCWKTYRCHGNSSVHLVTRRVTVWGERSRVVSLHCWRPRFTGCGAPTRTVLCVCRRRICRRSYTAPRGQRVICVWHVLVPLLRTARRCVQIFTWVFFLTAWLRSWLLKLSSKEGDS